MKPIENMPTATRRNARVIDPALFDGRAWEVTIDDLGAPTVNAARTALRAAAKKASVTITTAVVDDSTLAVQATSVTYVPPVEDDADATAGDDAAEAVTPDEVPAPAPGRRGRRNA